jgi:RAB protein geranylgeranyltransferase component A
MSGLMSVDKKKVLHIDKNDYYGGAAASLTLDQLFTKFAAGEPGAVRQTLHPAPAKKGSCPVVDAAEHVGRSLQEMGSKRDYNCDLIPKFVMAKGLLVKILLHTRTTHYLDFAKVQGSCVHPSSRSSPLPPTSLAAAPRSPRAACVLCVGRVGSKPKVAEHRVAHQRCRRRCHRRYVNAKGRIAKVPVTAAEALASSLMGACAGCLSQLDGSQHHKTATNEGLSGGRGSARGGSPLRSLS